MRRKWSILTLGLLAVTAFATQAMAQSGWRCQDMDDCGYEGMMGRTHERMGKKSDLKEMFWNKVEIINENSAELGITDDQMQKIRMLQMNTKKSMIKNDSELKLLAIDLEGEIRKDEIDGAAVNTIIDKKYAIKIQETKMLAGALADLKKIISKDQAKKIREIWKKTDRDEWMTRGDRMGMMGSWKYHGRSGAMGKDQ